jgi:hypothetical protein
MIVNVYLKFLKWGVLLLFFFPPGAQCVETKSTFIRTFGDKDTFFFIFLFFYLFGKI